MLRKEFKTQQDKRGEEVKAIWVKLYETIADDSKPRLLTEEEIENVLKSIPDVVGGTQESREIQREQLLNYTEKVLRSEDVSPAQLQNLSLLLMRSVYAALIEPFTSIGVRVAEVIGSKFTQACLNTFKTSAGASKNAIETISILNDILSVNVKVPRKSRESTIIFKDKNMDFYDVLRDMRSEIEQIRITDLISNGYTGSQTVDKPINADVYSVSYNSKFNDITDEVSRDYDWYRFFYRRLLTEEERVECRDATKILRLRLDPYVLYSRGISPEDIRDLLSNEYPQVLFCIFQPRLNVKKGDTLIFDIYSMKSELKKILNENLKKNKKYKGHTIPDLTETLDLESFFLFSVVREGLMLRIKGISDITDFTPVVIRRTGMINTTKKIVVSKNPILKKKIEEYKRHIWNITLNDKFCKKFGVTIKDLKKLFDVSGIINLNISDTDYYLILPSREELGEEFDKFAAEEIEYELLKKEEVTYQLKMDYIERHFNENPIGRINFLIAREKAINRGKLELQKRKVENKQESGSTFLTRGPYQLAGEIVYARCLGSNLPFLLSNEHVDPILSYSNDFHDVYTYLGSEAVRTVIINELSEISETSDANIDASFIILLADFIINGASPLGIKYTTVERRGTGWMTSAGQSRAKEVIYKNVIKGTTDPGGITQNLTTNTIIPLGTGSVQLEPIGTEEDKFTEAELKEAKNLIRERNVPQIIKEGEDYVFKEGGGAHMRIIRRHKITAREHILGKSSLRGTGLGLLAGTEKRTKFNLDFGTINTLSDLIYQTLNQSFGSFVFLEKPGVPEFDIFKVDCIADDYNSDYPVGVRALIKEYTDTIDVTFKGYSLSLNPVIEVKTIFF